ncbi:GGDEF domain-containing protein [Sphingomonas solaris]|uniref:GGDEF domain-containing protein n=1 Tax=Alterirhizorhabdus solaris TaxID=2529389 RepID=A0A558RC42_9SPHN|nr:GGDEF domain-containing protein [Sphingomonas solaris]TVV76910.1 GGDEF domain-containing protein [Sphingomonas solaris]
MIRPPGIDTDNSRPTGISESAIGNAIVVVGAALTALLAIRFQAFERFASFSRGFEHFQIDEALVALPVLAAAVAIIFMRRNRGLRAKLRLSEIRESAAYIAAREDALTGLANQRGFTEALESACDGGTSFCLFVIDLDGFKALNDRCGHAVGDKALGWVGERLRSATALVGALCAGRIGGDEFGVIVFGNPNPDGVAASILATLGHGFKCDGCSAGLNASIGYARASGRSVAAGDLLRQADAAMYRVKRAGGAGWRGAEESSASYSGHTPAISRARNA